MPLEVHHLHLSQSERVTWLLEELNIPYDLHVYKRDAQTALAPKELKELSSFGTAPYFRDTNVSPPVCLAESGAIVEYIANVYGPKAPSGLRLVRTPQDAEYGEYLQWLHFANGSLQPTVSRHMVFLLAGLTDDSPIVAAFTSRTQAALQHLNDRLQGHKYLAGEELSLADIMSVFSLTTMRGFYPKLDLGPYPHLLRYLKDIAARPAYREALKKGDFDMEPMIGAKVKGYTHFAAYAQALKDE